MGVVFLAEDPLLHRNVAIKMLDLSLEEGTQREFMRDRLLRDARAAAILSHPNIVNIHDVIEEGGAAYIVMEYLAGESLASYLKHHPLPEASFVVKVLRAMAAGLDYTHSRGIVHRDIKPANVMFDASGTVKILDFGIARMSDATTATPTGMVIGTVQYMAPEQIKGEAVDGRADQFSLAAVAYQMMTGSTLFGYHTLATLTYKIVNEMPPSMQTRNAALPSTVDVVVAKALSKLPAGRFESCTAFVDELDGALTGNVRVPPVPDDRTSLATQPLTTPAAPAEAPPVKRSVLVAIAAGMFVLIGAGSFLIIRKPWVRPDVPSAAVTETAPVSPPAAATRAPDTIVTPPPSAEKSAEPAASEPVKVGSEAAPTPPPETTTQPPVVVKKAEVPKPKPRKKEPEVAPVPTPEPLIPPAENVEVQAPDTDKTPAPQPAVQAYRRGRELLRGHDYEAAVRSFTTALALRPDYAAAYHFRGLAHQSQGRHVMAINDYSEAIRVRPDDALSYRDRGLCHLRLQHDDQALADFNETIKLRPESPETAAAFNGRGEIAMRRKQYNSALHDFNLAITLSPEYETAYRNRGQVKHALGHEPGAAADLRKAEELRAAVPAR